MSHIWNRIKGSLRALGYVVAIILLVAALLSLPLIFERLTAQDEQAATIRHIDQKTERILRENTDLRVLEKRIDELERKINDAGSRLSAR